MVQAKRVKDEVGHVIRTSSARAEICSYARKHCRSVDILACTPPDIIKPGDILRNPSGALEG